MKFWVKGLGLLCGSATVSAYTNDTMTPSYKMLYYGDPIYAFLNVFETSLGAGWFYMGLALAPWLALYLSQGDIHLPTMWLTVVVVAYGTLFTVPTPIFYMVGVMWVLSVLYRILGSKYQW